MVWGWMASGIRSRTGCAANPLTVSMRQMTRSLRGLWTCLRGITPRARASSRFARIDTSAPTFYNQAIVKFESGVPSSFYAGRQPRKRSERSPYHMRYSNRRTRSYHNRRRASIRASKQPRLSNGQFATPTQKFLEDVMKVGILIVVAVGVIIAISN